MRERYCTEDNAFIRRYELDSHRHMLVHYELIDRKPVWAPADPIANQVSEQVVERCDELVHEALEVLERLNEVCCGVIEFVNGGLRKEVPFVTIRVPVSPVYLKKVLADVDCMKDAWPREDDSELHNKDTLINMELGCRDCVDVLRAHIKRRWG